MVDVCAHINKTKPIAIPIPIYSPVSSPTNKDDVGTEYDLMEHFFDELSKVLF